MDENRYRDPPKRYHSLTKDALVEAIDVPWPEKLETTEDYAQLTQHMVSTFRLALNIYYRKYGYEARLELLTMMVSLLGSIPEENPELLRHYPDNMDDIYTLVGSLFIMAADGNYTKKAG